MDDHIFLNCGETKEDIFDHRSYTDLSSCDSKAWKNLGLNGTRNYDTGAVLYQMRYQAIWELVTLWVVIYP